METLKNTDNVLVVSSEQSALDSLRSQLESKVSRISGSLQSDVGAHSSEGPFDGVVSFSSLPHANTFVGDIAKLLKNGGRLILREPALKNAASGDAVKKIGLKTDKELFLSLTMGGFVDIKSSFTSSTSRDFSEVEKAAAGSPDLKDNIGIIEVVSSKPDWSVGAAHALPKRSNVNATNGSTAKNEKKAAVWTLNSDDVDEQELESRNYTLIIHRCSDNE
eukprot:TRINITY_DN1055_c0_g1_i2.p1 TRINITY_DN1055_c0_g1~~TRINITY_DN1055_c0_g1_i2.p1  ORF type:complete len:220 (+),score=49.34 TRINITY_DN1055_c0_g1_i2:41-700(+)